MSEHSCFGTDQGFLLVLRVFLGFSFRKEDRDLVGDVQTLLEAQGVQLITGEVTAGEALTPAIKTLIEGADALVALLTAREQKANGRFTTHDWVRDELNHAREKHKPAIALVDKAVDLAGFNQEHERIDYDSKSPLPAFLKLSRTIGEWHRKAGNRVKIRVLPVSLVRKIGAGDAAACSYRLTNDGQSTDWLEGRILREVGGTFAYVSGVQRDSLIELRVRLGDETWFSVAEPQWMQMKLAREPVE
jgi:TIR domain